MSSVGQLSLQAIGTIQSGDSVYAMDFETGTWTLRRVNQRIDSIYQGQLVTIETATGDLIQSTPGHPFWVVSGNDLDSRPACKELDPLEDQDQSLAGRWVNSHDLQSGDILYDRDGSEQTVHRITTVSTPGIPVSNLTIDGLHSYAVGTAGLLVHNVSLCDAEIDLRVQEVVTNNKTLDEVLRPLIDEGVDRASLEKIIERTGKTPSDDIAEAVARSGKLEGATNVEVFDPNTGNIITDIDEIRDGVLWEIKTATFPYKAEKWIEKHITNKFSKYMNARQYLPGYENAPIGFKFNGKPNDAEFISLLRAEIDRLRSMYPSVEIRLEGLPN